jgi:hypothetical protein
MKNIFINICILQNPASSKIENAEVQIIWGKGVRVAEDM